jgi:hypothetical protein
MNRFENPNAEPWFRWIFRRQDSLPFVTVYFLSRKNSTSPRFFPLYDRSKNFRIVVVRGINLPYTDRIGLLLHKIIVRTFRKKINRYIWQSPTNLHSAMSAKNNILLHLDDPLYSVWEQKMIVRLLERSREQKKILVVACTNRYTKDYLNSFLPSENSMIVPQGHLSDFQFDEGDDFIECTDRVFKVVYSSPYIDVKGDKHQDHIFYWNSYQRFCFSRKT